MVGLYGMSPFAGGLRTIDYVRIHREGVKIMNEEMHRPSPEELTNYRGEGPQKVETGPVSAVEKVALTSERAHLRGEARRLAGADNSIFCETSVREWVYPNTGETAIIKDWFFRPDGSEGTGSPYVHREQKIFFNLDGEITQIIGRVSDEQGLIREAEVARDHQGRFRELSNKGEKDLTQIHARMMAAVETVRRAREKHAEFLARHEKPKEV